MKRRSILYSAPDGGHALRTRDVHRVHDATLETLQRFTTDTFWLYGQISVDVVPTTEALVGLVERLDEGESSCTIDALRAIDASTPLLERVFSRFGPSELRETSSLWGGTPLDSTYTCEWHLGYDADEPGDPADLREAVAIAAEFADLTTDRDDHPLSVDLHSSFLAPWTTPGTTDPLPFQDEAHYDEFGSGCGANFFLVLPSRHLLLDLRFPFESVNSAFDAYFNALDDSVGCKLSRKRLRLAIVNKKGDGFFTRRPD